MSTNQPLVSVIAINWNNLQVTSEFLHSIKERNDYNNIEIIIVDNNSDIDPSPSLKNIYPDVKVIRNSSNLGFSGANNVGIKAAKGEFFFIVNNDTEFTAGLIQGLVDIFYKFPKAGICSPKFHYYFNKGIIEYAGYECVNVLTGRNSMIGCREQDEGQYDEIKETHYAHGGGMMVPRKVVEEVGMMPEKFFLYYEEFDWCTQIKNKGFKVYYQPNSLIYHKESMTTGKSSPLKTFYLTRNRILFMRRNVSLVRFVIFLAYFVSFTIPKNTFQYLLQRKNDHLMSFWKGIMWHLNSKITYN